MSGCYTVHLDASQHVTIGLALRKRRSQVKSAIKYYKREGMNRSAEQAEERLDDINDALEAIEDGFYDCDLCDHKDDCPLLGTGTTCNGPFPITLENGITVNA